jgi:hypothetical protein
MNAIMNIRLIFFVKKDGFGKTPPEVELKVKAVWLRGRSLNDHVMPTRSQAPSDHRLISND